MKTRRQRAKRLLWVQGKLLLAERLQLQTLTNALDEARHAEENAIALLNEETPPRIPVGFLVRRAALSAAKIKDGEALLVAQVEKTLDHARKEQLVRKKLAEAIKAFSRTEEKVSLQATIDAYVASSLEQES